MYIAAARGRQLQGTKFLCQQKPLVTSVICYKFQKNLFEVWFYTFFFHDFIHVYSPRAAAAVTPWDEILMSTGTFPHPIEALYEIWLWLAQWFLAQWFLRRICLKSVDNGWRRTMEAYLSYKLIRQTLQCIQIQIPRKATMHTCRKSHFYKEV